MSPEELSRARMKFYRRSPTKLGDFQAALPTTQFLAMVGHTQTYSEAGYDPGDPCTTGYNYSLKIVTLESEEEVAEWVKMHMETEPKVPYQIIKVAPVSITTTVSVNLG